MADPRFFTRAAALTLAEVANISGASLAHPAHASRKVEDVAPLDRASPADISFLDNTKYMASFEESHAGACFIREKYAEHAPETMALLLTEDPYRCYALIAQRFYPFIPQTPDISPHAHIDASAKIGKGCAIGPGVFIGRKVEIGDNCSIGANTVIQEGVMIGQESRIGPLCSISHTYIGERVTIHRGVHLGQDGFGFALHREGHVKVPQLGRVMIENDVEIGAGTCIDRGTGPDTVIGEGSKIDNLVQIGHNVMIGKRAVIVAQVGIAGSTRIGDGAVLGGQVGIAGHLKIGPGAKLAAKAGVMSDIPAGAAYGGSPAVPVKEWHRQTLALNKLIRKIKGPGDDE